MINEIITYFGILGGLVFLIYMAFQGIRIALKYHKYKKTLQLKDKQEKLE